jgi:hypothetical protein
LVEQSRISESSAVAKWAEAAVRSAAVKNTAEALLMTKNAVFELHNK